jgi:MSHA pilin protein MshC
MPANDRHNAVPRRVATGRGYSLIELVVTITVATILAAVAIPYFSQSSADASWFNEQAKAAVRYAQRQAVAQRRSVHVVITGTQIRLCYVAACSPGTEVSDLSTGNPYVVAVPTGMNITIPSGGSFSFNGLGQPFDSGGSASAPSFNAGSGPVTVTAETGYVP